MGVVPPGTKKSPQKTTSSCLFNPQVLFPVYTLTSTLFTIPPKFNTLSLNTTNSLVHTFFLLYAPSKPTQLLTTTTTTLTTVRTQSTSFFFLTVCPLSLMTYACIANICSIHSLSNIKQISLTSTKLSLSYICKLLIIGWFL